MRKAAVAGMVALALAGCGGGPPSAGGGQTASPSVTTPSASATPIQPSPSPTASASTPTPVPTGTAAYYADIERVGFGDADTSAAEFVTLGKAICKALGSGVSYDTAIRTVKKAASTHPTSQQAENVVASAARNLCPRQASSTRAPATKTVTVTAKPPTAARPPASTTIDGSGGVQLVGSDVKPGTYRTKRNSGCYWARLKGTSGELKDIIVNGNVTGSAIVTIRSSDKAFESNRCSDWQKIG